MSQETENPDTAYVLDFGKHRGKPLDDIMRIDPCYADWLEDAGFTSQTLKAAITKVKKAHKTNKEQDRPEDLVMPFGKHRGSSLGDILYEDPSYLDWLADADIAAPRLRNAISYMNQKYAKEIEAALDER